MMPELPRCLRTLVRLGAAAPGGEGWNAGYDISVGWLSEHDRLLQALTPGEQQSVAKAGKRLAVYAGMLSKNTAASPEARLVTT
jgi:hypothetical protein